MSKNNLLAIGWDVGGWMGANHGFSIICWDYEQKKYSWLGDPVELRIPAKSLFSLNYILQKVIGENEIKINDYDLVIGIDAPLSFPRKFKDFINGKEKAFYRPEKEIYNQLAYRKTDVHIYEELAKKPLSAVFDRLGTNATVAIAHLNKWVAEHNFSVQPMLNKNNQRDLIEVYPALLKASKYAAAAEPFKDMIPESVKVGTDAYDSALCAIMALAYGAGSDFKKLPNLVGPEVADPKVKDEGWIYYFPVKNK